MSPTPLRPERPKNQRKLRLYFTDYCSECGRVHFYRKYQAWDTSPQHLPLCFPRRHEQGELDL
jgi:hypothetical protein